MIPGTVGVVLRGRPWWRHLRDLIVAWGSRSQAVHAFVVIDGDRIVEAEPEGAIVNCVAAHPGAVFSTWPLTNAQQAAIVEQAERLIGTPYNWYDDMDLGLARRFGMHTPHFIMRRLADPTHLQCAQLVDLAYRRAGIVLFADGRLDGDVTPGDLYDLIRADTSVLP